MKKYDMEVPAGVPAYRLLKSVGISEDKQQLARATLPSLTYDCMKKQLKIIYDNTSQENSLSNMKVEPVFETRWYNGNNRQIEGYYQSNRGQNNSYCGSQGRGKFGRGKANQSFHDSGGSINNELRKKNPVNSYEKVTCCGICESMYHWAKESPHKESGPHNNTKVTLFSQEAQKCFVENVLGKILNYAVVDSGCTKTVCREEWLKCYIHSLSDLEKKKIQSFATNIEFSFGDVKSVVKCMLIPQKIAGKAVTIKTDVMNSDQFDQKCSNIR